MDPVSAMLVLIVAAGIGMAAVVVANRRLRGRPDEAAAAPTPAIGVADLKPCPACGAANLVKDETCLSCGKPLPAAPLREEEAARPG